MYLLLGHLRYFYRSFFNKNIKTIHTKKSPSLFNHSFKPLFSVNGEEMNAFSYYLVNKTKYNYLYIYIYIMEPARALYDWLDFRKRFFVNEPIYPIYTAYSLRNN